MHQETDQNTHLQGKYLPTTQRPHALVHSPVKKSDSSHYQTSTHKLMRKLLHRTYTLFHILLPSPANTSEGNISANMSHEYHETDTNKQDRKSYILGYKSRNGSEVPSEGKYTHKELWILTPWTYIPQQFRELTSWDVNTKIIQRPPLLAFRLSNSWAHKFWDAHNQRNQRLHALIHTPAHRSRPPQQTHTQEQMWSSHWDVHQQPYRDIAIWDL